MEGYEVLVLSAEGDGVAPSLLVSPIAPLKGPQYLFNCPEGFARLAIEHKVRPSGKLAAVFLTSLLPQAAAGLPGLFLRLAVDGHEKIETCGPPGTAAYVHAQRYIVHWVHPQVTVNQAVLDPSQKPIFQDGRVSVLPIFASAQEVACPCCLDGDVTHGLREASGLGQSKPEAKTAAVLEVGSSESESESESEREEKAVPELAVQTEGKGDRQIAADVQIERQGQLPEAAVVGSPSQQKIGREEKAGTGSVRGAEPMAAVGVTRNQQELDRDEDGAVELEPVGGAGVILDEGLMEGLAKASEKEKGSELEHEIGETGTREATAAVDPVSRQSQRPGTQTVTPPAVDLSTSSSDASESAESESESESVKKPVKRSRMPQNDDVVQRRLSLQTKRRGLRPERVALFAQLDSIFGGAGVGAPMDLRQLALTTMTSPRAPLGGSPMKNSPQKQTAHKREKVELGAGRATKGGGKKGAKTAVEVSGFKRRRKVVEITSSGGEAFSMEESVEVELTRVRSDVRMTSPAADTDEVCQPDTGKRQPSNNAGQTGHEADFAEGGALAEKSSEDEGECLTQLLSPSPKGSKRRRREGGEAEEALFAQLDDIFKVELDAKDARNKALQRLEGRLPATGDPVLGAPGKIAPGGKGVGGAVLGLSKTESTLKPMARDELIENAGPSQGPGNSAPRTKEFPGSESGVQLAVEAAAVVGSFGEGLVGAARLRGGAPRNDKWGRRGVPYWALEAEKRRGVVSTQDRGHLENPGGQGQNANAGRGAPPWKKRFFGAHQDSNSEDSDTWREEALESGMDWLLRSSSGRKARRARKGLPPGTGAGAAAPAGGGAVLAGGVPPRPQQRVQLDTHAPSTNPVFVRTAMGAVPIEEGLEGLKENATGGKGALLGYLAVFGPPVNGSIFMVDCREEATCSQLTSIRFPTCVSNRKGAHRLIAVFHFTPADLAACQPYKEWMGSFGAHVRHVMLSDRNGNLGYRATYGTLARLNLVDASIFPLAGNASGTAGAKGKVSDGGKERNTGLASEPEGLSPIKAKPRKECEPGSLGLLASVVLRGRRPGSNAPAEVDESRCLERVNVKGIQARVLADQPALGYWRSGGKLEAYEAAAGAGLHRSDEGAANGGTERKRNGKEVGDAGPKASVVAPSKPSEQQEKLTGEAAASGGARTAAASGIARNANQAELQFERQLAEQAAALQAHWHVLSPMLNKGHCGSAKPHPRSPRQQHTATSLGAFSGFQTGSMGNEPNRVPDLGSPRTRTGLHFSPGQRNSNGMDGLAFTGPSPQLLFLGTGSAEPSKYRGGSAILLNLTPHAALLMDCGEGAAGQLLRTAGLVPSAGLQGLGNEDGRARAARVAQKIRVLWVSHKHADHCLGVLGVLELRGSDEPRLLVLGPVAVQRWLEEVTAAMQDNGHTLPPYTFRHCRELGSLIETANQPPRDSGNQGLNRSPNSGLNTFPNQGVNPLPNQSFNTAPEQGFNPGLNQGVSQGLHVDVPGFGLGHPPSPRDWQRPSFGQPSRASYAGSEQQGRPETFLAGQQQLPASGGRQQGYQSVEQGYFQQQLSLQSGASQYAHLQPAPGIAHTVRSPRAAQQQPFDPQTQSFPPPPGPFSPNQYSQRPRQAPIPDQFQRSNASIVPTVPAPRPRNSGLNQSAFSSAPNPPNVAARLDPLEPPNPANSSAGDACAALNLVKAQAVPVHHCADSWGLVIHHRDGWSLVYSGDTRPTRPLIEAGRGCTLLIHEATFEGKLLDHARRKRHSTTEEALDAAAQMGAQRTILTHFSQRYPKAVEFASNLPAADSTCIAFDGMVVPFADLGRLPSLLQPIRLALADVEKTETEQGA